jgi:hypothetical protein
MSLGRLPHPATGDMVAQQRPSISTVASGSPIVPTGLGPGDHWHELAAGHEQNDRVWWRHSALCRLCVNGGGVTHSRSRGTTGVPG